MSRLNELIEKLCPNGVEYKPLWSLTAWDKKFNGVDKSKQKKVISYKYYLSTDFDKVERENGNIKYISTGISREDRYTTEEFAGDYLAEGEIVCIPWGGTPNVKYHKGRFVTGDNRIATSLDINTLDNKFLYYWMQSNIGNISSFYRGSGIKHPNMSKVLDMCIPVPPLEVQCEIVHILDNFTLLSAELSAELKARQRQYEYYRDKLLYFKDARFMKLSEVCKLVTGATPSTLKKEYWNDGIINWMNSGEVNLKYVYSTEKKITLLGYKNASTTLVPPHSVVIALAGQGKTRGKVAITEIELCTNQSLCSMICDEKIINYKYLYYYLDSKYENLRAISNGNGTRGGLSLRILAPYEIPVPSIEKQQEILDKLDKLCNGISDGLPAEIEARQRQYEYYRDKLLNFKELKVEN